MVDKLSCTDYGNGIHVFTSLVLPYYHSTAACMYVQWTTSLREALFAQERDLAGKTRALVNRERFVSRSEKQAATKDQENSRKEAEVSHKELDASERERQVFERQQAVSEREVGVSEAEAKAAQEERRLSVLSEEVTRKKVEADERETRLVIFAVYFFSYFAFILFVVSPFCTLLSVVLLYVHNVIILFVWVFLLSW